MITHLAIATLWNRIYRLGDMFTIQGVLNIIDTKFFLAAADEMTVLKFFRQYQSINKLCLIFMECLNACFICLVHRSRPIHMTDSLGPHRENQRSYAGTGVWGQGVEGATRDTTRHKSVHAQNVLGAMVC